MKATIAQAALAAALKDLADAASLAEGVPNVCSSVCAAVANLIAGAGAFGSGGQRNMMDLASEAGFAPEFYVNSIRVHWVAK